MFSLPTISSWDGLHGLSHASMVIPLLLWLRRGPLRPTVRPLVAYAWLGLVTIVLEHNVSPQAQGYQLAVVIVLNLSKIGLLAAVYYQELRQPMARYSVLGLAVATLLGGLLGLWPPDAPHLHWVANYARLGQCAVLASFALTYFEQLLTSTTIVDLSRDSLFLLSVGQLLYSALTVTYFSLVSSSQLLMMGEPGIGLGLLGAASLLFNGFLSGSIYYGNRPAASLPAR